MKAKEFFHDIKTSIEIKKLNTCDFKIIYRSLDVNGKELHHGHNTRKVNSLNENIKSGGVADIQISKHYSHVKEVIKKYFPEELI
jgi:hypothetical protein